MDRRVRKTRQALTEAFLALAQQKPEDQISVQELTNLADVGRGTFYLHYQTVQDLADQITADSLQDLLDKFTQAAPVKLDGAYTTWLNGLMQYLTAHKAAFTRIAKNPVTPSLHTQLVTGFEAPLPYEAAVNCFLVNGAIGLIKTWLTQSQTLSQAEVVALLNAQLLASDRNGLVNNSVK
ncbi:TetR/AcrR family transcriptional regulator [Lacticaseibacillus porcinae]|uniref:TetR/AcrR family transcriptional regulator n=1 Tax=Lacticaseibacillus porcinae TaxID=1123687 RepID=UPI000F7B52E6|nr:TetR/AcrR family transcriptional regulator [Lacticaseibacillus porcinae]